MDEGAYTRVPDPRIGLTSRGWEEADACGHRIRELVSTGPDDWKVYFYVSPYRRTLETLRGLGKAFEPERIAGVREEPRIREQDFGEKICFYILENLYVNMSIVILSFSRGCYICIIGNFQDREKMRVEKATRRRYGRFFYRFPNGESAADVYDRITGPFLDTFGLKFCLIPRPYLSDFSKQP